MRSWKPHGMAFSPAPLSPPPRMKASLLRTRPRGALVHTVHRLYRCV